MKLYFAPLEGVAGFIYRNAQIDMFGGADKYFAPFVCPSHNPKMAGKEIRDILPENNRNNIELIPQILANNSEYFIRGAKQIVQMGYKEINFNAGCPSGTVVSKGRGAGFLRDTWEMERFFDSVFECIDREGLEFDVSVKTRIGVEDVEEFPEILEVYNKYPFSEIIIHPRTRIQMYKGEPNVESFEYAVSNSKNKLCYNGNVYTVNDYKNITEKYSIDAVMMGRGVLRNPNLFNEIRGGEKITLKQIYEFQNRIYNDYKEKIPSDKQVLYKMKEVWNYLSYNFSEQHKCEKLVRKAQDCRQYDKAVNEIMEKMELV